MGATCVPHHKKSASIQFIKTEQFSFDDDDDLLSLAAKGWIMKHT